jgi:biopolymer transport protein ExbB
MSELFRQAIEIWASGGWAMIALAFNGLFLFGIGVHIWLSFRSHGVGSLPETKWKRWVAKPEERRGPIGRLIDFAMGAPDIKELGIRFDELHATEVAPFTRDLRFMKAAVTTAPLLGLLGTVMGMLTTFKALSLGSGGQKTMDMVAGGISEALITTETGLILGLMGLFLQYKLTRDKDRFEAFLVRLQGICSQYIYRARKNGGGLAVETGGVES